MPATRHCFISIYLSCHLTLPRTRGQHLSSHTDYVYALLLRVAFLWCWRDVVFQAHAATISPIEESSIIAGQAILVYWGFIPVTFWLVAAFESSPIILGGLLPWLASPSPVLQLAIKYWLLKMASLDHDAFVDFFKDMYWLYAGYMQLYFHM